MNQINAAYDQIKNGTAQQGASGGYGGQGYGGYSANGYSSGYNPWGAWSGWGEWSDFSGASARQQEPQRVYRREELYPQRHVQGSAQRALRRSPRGAGRQSGTISPQARICTWATRSRRSKRRKRLWRSNRTTSSTAGSLSSSRAAGISMIIMPRDIPAGWTRISCA